MRTKVFQSIDAADRARLPDLLASWSVQRCEWLVAAPEKNQAELLLAELLVLLVLVCHRTSFNSCIPYTLFACL